MDFGAPVNHRINIKELEKLWNRVPIVICALGTISEGLVKGLEELELRGRADIIQIIALLRLVRIPRKVLDN